MLILAIPPSSQNRCGTTSAQTGGPLKPFEAVITHHRLPRLVLQEKL